MKISAKTLVFLVLLSSIGCTVPLKDGKSIDVDRNILMPSFTQDSFAVSRSDIVDRMDKISDAQPAMKKYRTVRTVGHAGIVVSTAVALAACFMPTARATVNYPVYFAGMAGIFASGFVVTLGDLYLADAVDIYNHGLSPKSSNKIYDRFVPVFSIQPSFFPKLTTASAGLKLVF